MAKSQPMSTTLRFIYYSFLKLDKSFWVSTPFIIAQKTNYWSAKASAGNR
jgi:hypothetical protein